MIMIEYERFRLVGYVCDGSCFKEHLGEGTLTYHQIYMQRPDTCRYAVVEQTGTNLFMVVDLYTTTMRKTGVNDYIVSFAPGEGTCLYPTEDAAVAATLIRYKE